MNWNDIYDRECCVLLLCDMNTINIKESQMTINHMSFTGSLLVAVVIKVPNYNEKLRSSVTVQEFFFASFEFSPSEFKRSNASTSTDYIWSRPVHCSRAPRRTDSDCHHCTLGNNRQLRILISITITVAD